MSKEQNETREELERLANALVDDIDAMSDEELLAELDEAGEDAGTVADQTRTLIADAVAKVGRRKLAAARSGYEASQTGHQSNVLQWSMQRKRGLIQHFVQNNNEFEQKWTLAAREGKDMEADMNSFIEDLIDLGVIDDEGNPT